MAFGAIEAQERPERLPLSFSQERVWFLEQLMPGNIAYNAYLTIRFQGKLDVAALARALTEIVRRHEILRTTFVEHDGELAQLVTNPPSEQGAFQPCSPLPGSAAGASHERISHAGPRGGRGACRRALTPDPATAW